MRFIIETLLVWFVKFLLSLRYRIDVKGLKELGSCKGTLFLPNHPAEIDPVIVTCLLYPQYKVRPVVLESMYTLPVLHTIMKYIDSIPIPSMEEGVSSYKLKRSERIVTEIVEKLKSGENILLYPAGGLQRSGLERLKGASGVANIIKAHPEVPVVTIRSRGLWGSSFGVAQTEGITPDVMTILSKNFLRLLKGAIFCLPRRKVWVECEQAGIDFPRSGDKFEINGALEKYYNAPGEEEPSLVSYSFWFADQPEYKPTPDLQDLNLDEIDPAIQEGVKEEFAKMCSLKKSEIEASMSLGEDLGLDSLDRSEILIWLDSRFHVQDVEIAELVTVGNVMQIASGRANQDQAHSVRAPEAWEEVYRPDVKTPEGATIIEAFLRNAFRMKDYVAGADENSGVLKYKRFLIGSMALARAIEKLPGDKIGVMLPATAGVGLVTLATMLARKTPVMINWTLGSRNLDHVKSITGLQSVLTSGRFLDKLGLVDLGPIEENFVLLEDLRAQISLKDKLSAAFLSWSSPESVLRSFQCENLKEDDTAVILFTSGSESVPKGVPLSHSNILSNIKDCLGVIPFESKDALYGFLPPFHSFGFTITTFLPLTSGLKVAYYPNPTESRRLARGIRMWGITTVCGTPSFVQGIFQASQLEDLSSVRYFVTGAEKAPEELFEKVRTLGAVMLEGYGITECAPVLAMNYPGRPRAGVGFPAPSVQVKIVNLEDYNQELSQGELGMILAKGPNVFSGYLGTQAPNPFHSAEGTNWYVTGDLGFLNEEGALNLGGRKKRFVKIAGEMISLPAIESILLEKFPKPESSDGEEEGPALAVEALELEGARPIMVLFTTNSVTLEQANEALKEAGFANVGRLTKAVELKSIPLLGTGKTDYRGLKSMIEQEA